MVLRKGGIAIAGPGGAATAYTGGTAIVGPYGTVYKSPQGTAIMGPFSKIVHITDDTDFEDIIRMHKESQNRRRGGSSFARKEPLKNGLKNYKNLFSYKTNLPIKIEFKPRERDVEEGKPNGIRLRKSNSKESSNAKRRKIVKDAPVEQKIVKTNETALIFRPKSKAEAGRNGIAVSAPSSHAILFPGQKASIYFEPESVASAGPSGFAHAYSDLFVTYVLNNNTASALHQN